MKNKPLLVATLLIGATVILNFFVPKPGEYTNQGDKISANLPFQFADWRTEGDLGVSEDVKRILGTDDIIHRYYFEPTEQQPVLLSLVFSGGHRHSMHPPEVCYQSQGHTLTGRKQADLPSKCEATVLNLTDGSGDETLVNYWFYSEGRETPSYMWHQVHLVMNQVMFRSQPSVLIRLSTEVLNGDQAGAQDRLARFTEVAIPEVRRVLGEAVTHGGEQSAKANP